MAGRFLGSGSSIGQATEQRETDEGGSAESIEALESTSDAFCKGTNKQTESGPSSSNVFLPEKHSKVIEKKPLSMEIAEALAGSKESDDSIASEIDGDIASYEARAVAAAAEAMRRTIKQSNMDLEAAMSSVPGTSGDRSRASSGFRNSLTKTQLAAQIAREAGMEAHAAADAGRKLMEVLRETIDTIEAHVSAFKEKALAVSESDTDESFQEADFYHTMATKYEAAIEALKRRGKKVVVAVDRAMKAGDTSLRYAAFAEAVTNDMSDEAKRVSFDACMSKNKAEAVCIVALTREHALLLAMKRVWITVREDANIEEEIPDDSISEHNQQCENRDRKTRIAHIAAFAVGVAILGSTALFEVGSDSFYAILCLGVLTSGWATIYWSHKFYRCIKSRNTDATCVVRGTRDGFIKGINRRLTLIESYLRKHNVVPTSDSESDGGSWETVRIDEIVHQG